MNRVTVVLAKQGAVCFVSEETGTFSHVDYVKLFSASCMTRLTSEIDIYVHVWKWCNGEKRDKKVFT